MIHLFFDIYLSKFRQTIPDKLIEEVADSLKITPAEVTNYIQSYSTDIQITDNSIRSKRFGGLDRQSDPVEKSKQKFSREFFSTSLVSNLVEAIIGSCKFGDNMLLVGEAGSGKTTIVQETAKLVG